MIQITTITLQDFQTLLKEAVKNELENFKRNWNAKKDTNLIARKDVALILGVNLSTVHLWTESGKLIPYRIGRKVYYRRTDNPMLQ